MITIPTVIANQVEYITADELAELLDAAPTPGELVAALRSAPVDLQAVGSLLADIVAGWTRRDPEEFAEALHAAVQACARPGHVISVEFAALILRAASAYDGLAAAAAHRRATLLADIAEGIRARDADGLLVALNMAPYSLRAYIDHLFGPDNATMSDRPHDPARLRAAQMCALRASATPGTVMDDDLADAILDGMVAWITMTNESPEQRAVRDAFAEARRLLDLHGDDDPRALDAVFKAVELQDPGCCRRKLAECGITLPTPTHCNAEGEGLLTLEQVADALGVDPDDLVPALEEMEAAGMNVRHIPAGALQ
jgi:hypothetical protein